MDICIVSYLSSNKIIKIISIVFTLAYWWPAVVAVASPTPVIQIGQSSPCFHVVARRLTGRIWWKRKLQQYVSPTALSRAVQQYGSASGTCCSRAWSSCSLDAWYRHNTPVFLRILLPSSTTERVLRLLMHSSMILQFASLNSQPVWNLPPHRPTWTWGVHIIISGSIKTRN